MMSRAVMILFNGEVLWPSAVKNAMPILLP